MSKLIEQLKFEEGLRLTVYRCPAGKRTIGYGHNLDANPNYKGQLIPEKISKEFAVILLVQDVTDIEEELGSRWPEFHKIDNHVRRDALVNMAFQLGVTGLLKFKRTLNYVQQNFWQSAAESALASKWAEQVPGRALRVSGQLSTGIPYEIPNA